MKGKSGSFFRRRQTSMPSILGIMMSSRMRSGGSALTWLQRLFSVAGRADVVAVNGEAGLKDIQVGGIVVGNQDLLGLSQRGTPGISGK